jgi:hypothetical protein
VAGGSDPAVAGGSDPAVAIAGGRTALGEPVADEVPTEGQVRAGFARIATRLAAI